MKTFVRTLIFAVLCMAGHGPALGAAVDWPFYNGNLRSDRFSPLTEITSKNVTDLREACEVSLGDPGTFQPGPVVVGGTLYVATAHTVVAMDAANCAVRWRYVYRVTDDAPMPFSRGLAYLDGHLFRGTPDGGLVSIDAKTGKEIWRVKVADLSLAEFVSAAPIAWNGLVFIGPGGSDYGIQGRISAFDAKTGKEVWRFHTVPFPGEPGFETWQIPETAKHGGGGTWTSYTLDAKTSELFVSVGNPGPDFDPGSRPGKNLYTNALVVLDAKTGKLKWYFQADENDGFDYDLAAAPVLFTDKAGNRRIALGSKDGYLYILDRDSHQLLSKTAITTIKTPPTPPTPAGVYACPGPVGGVEWNGPAYSPITDQVYVGSIDWCMVFLSGKQKYRAPLTFFGTGIDMKGPGSRAGWVYGVKASTGAVAWRYHSDSPVLSGVTSTASGLLFSGDSAGNLLAFDAKTGGLLKKQNLGGSMGGGVVTYGVAGKQYVATSTGNISRSGLSTGTGMPRLIILTTGLKASGRPLVISAVPPQEAGKSFGGNAGKSIFNLFCATCHGPGGSGGEGGPVLVNETSKKSPAEIVAWIKNPAPPMPKLFPVIMSDDDVQEVARYVAALK